MIETVLNKAINKSLPLWCDVTDCFHIHLFWVLLENNTKITFTIPFDTQNQALNNVTHDREREKN